MKKRLVVLPILLVGSLAVLIGATKDLAKRTARLTQPSQKQPDILSGTVGVNTYQAQTKSFGAVDVEVIPEPLLVGQEAVFNVSLNTHSVELDYDYIQIANVTDDQGNSYRALAWDGGRSGHHLKGKLSFEALKEGIESIVLTISGIDNQTRSFAWRILP